MRRGRVVEHARRVGERDTTLSGTWHIKIIRPDRVIRDYPAVRSRRVEKGTVDAVRQQRYDRGTAGDVAAELLGRERPILAVDGHVMLSLKCFYGRTGNFSRDVDLLSHQ